MTEHSDLLEDNKGHTIDSPSHGKVPKWLEELSDNVRKNRPGSWKISHDPTDFELRTTGESQNIGYLSPDKLSPMVENLHLDQRCCSRLGLSSSGSEVCTSVIRTGSAGHGRRTSGTTGSRSAGNSPRKSPSELDKEEHLLKAAISRDLITERSVSSQSVRHKSSNDLSPTLHVPTSYFSGHVSKSEMHIEKNEGREYSLEESWSSLSFFNRRHKGRLSRKDDDHLLLVDPPLFDGCPESETVGSISSGRNTTPDFIIPELPIGHHLVINVKTTWGDRHYLGLNGIEIFSSSGEPVGVKEIWAEPSDINVLPEYSKDPRVIKNLLDGVNRTHDDMHLWLAPFTPGTQHVIQMAFNHRIQIAMIRIWNYNKSRIHSYRGAKDIEISLDGVVIFQGEIARACGGILGGTEAFGDTILFTTDENILESISQFDDSFSSTLSECAIEVTYQEVERPITAHNGDERPFTCAGQSHLDTHDSINPSTLLGGQKLEITLLANWGHPALIGLTGLQVIGESGAAIPLEPYYIQCSTRSPDIYRLIDGTNLTTDENHMWETGFLDSQPVVVTINFPSSYCIAGLRIWNYNSSPDLVYCGVKLLTVHCDGKLVSQGNQGIVTTRRAPGNCHFNFAQDLILAEEIQSNYSRDSESRLSQIRHSFSEQDVCSYSVTSQLPRDSTIGSPENQECEDNPTVTSGPAFYGGDGDVLGNAVMVTSPSALVSTYNFDVHEMERQIASRNSHVSSRINSGDTEYEAPVMPQGFVFQLLLLSTWGDMYYVGLNGLELYNENGDQIRLTENNIGAFPESVNILEGVNNDVRTPDKLVDGVNDTLDGRHMWLSPILPDQLNRVYIVFDYPVTVSMIKLWNYAKTPNRGVKEFGILVDDLLVYNGILDKTSSGSAKSQVKVPYRTVLFTSDKELRRQEYNTQIRNSSYGQNVQMLNDRQRVTSGGITCHSADQSQRPLTSLLPTNRRKSLHDL